MSKEEARVIPPEIFINTQSGALYIGRFAVNIAIEEEQHNGLDIMPLAVVLKNISLLQPNHTIENTGKKRQTTEEITQTGKWLLTILRADKPAEHVTGDIMNNAFSLGISVGEKAAASHFDKKFWKFRAAIGDGGYARGLYADWQDEDFNAYADRVEEKLKRTATREDFQALFDDGLGPSVTMIQKNAGTIWALRRRRKIKLQDANKHHAKLNKSPSKRIYLGTVPGLVDTTDDFKLEKDDFINWAHQTIILNSHINPIDIELFKKVIGTQAKFVSNQILTFFDSAEDLYAQAKEYTDAVDHQKTIKANEIMDEVRQGQLPSYILSENINTMLRRAGIYRILQATHTNFPPILTKNLCYKGPRSLITAVAKRSQGAVSEADIEMIALKLGVSEEVWKPCKSKKYVSYKV